MKDRESPAEVRIVTDGVSADFESGPFGLCKATDLQLAFGFTEHMAKCVGVARQLNFVDDTILALSG